MVVVTPLNAIMEDQAFIYYIYIYIYNTIYTYIYIYLFFCISNTMHVVVQPNLGSFMGLPEVCL